MAVLVLVLAVTAAGCGETTEPSEPDHRPGMPFGLGDPGPSPTPTATVSPEPVLVPVEGTVEVHRRTVSVAGNRVFPEGSAGDLPDEPDADVLAAFVEGIKAWLDAHLTAVQRGGVGAIDPTSGLAADAPPETLDALSTALAGPSRPVASAHYDITVWGRTDPEWASAVATITGPEGDDRGATFVFVPGAVSVELVAASADPSLTPPGPPEEG